MKASAWACPLRELSSSKFLESRNGLLAFGLLILAGLLGSTLFVDGQTFVDTGFSSELVASLPAFGPVGVDWAPDGRMFIWQKNGVVRIFKNGSLNSTPFLDFSSKINTYNDNGMFCLAFDPSFGSNRYIYLTYVYEPGTDPNDNHSKTSRLVRVTASSTNPDAMQAGSEVILLNNLPVDYGTHAAGTIRFAPDGRLFLGNGDGASPAVVDPNAWGAQDLNNVRGKIFRLTRDGKAPGDNPFDDGTDSIRSKVWCYGVRNPYRFSLHPVTAVPYFADVGWNSWEEIDRGVRGGNYGWPCYEGSRVQSGYQSGLSQCAGVTGIAPIYEYPHTSLGTCIVGGDFYTGTQYPDAYRGNYFFADYSGNFIRRLVLNASGTVTSTADFASDAGAPTCIEQGPDGLLYLVSLARGQIRRIRFNAPAANASATPTYGYSPLTVAFSSAGSVGSALSYLWDFGDGSRSSLPNPSHTYLAATPTTLTAKLTVTNSTRLSSSATVRITVGSVPPTPVISAPADGLAVMPGSTVIYQGSATDLEDGPLPASALSWTVLLHHNSHVHTFVGGSGTSGSFQVENHGPVGTFSYEIVLTATDSSGLSGTASVDLPVVADTVPPTVPTELTAVPVGSTRIQLSWQPAIDNAAVASYSIDRCAGAGCDNFSLVATATGTAFEDPGLMPTNTYSYRIRAVDFSGNSSGDSAVATATTLEGPAAALGLVAAYSFSEGAGASTADNSGHGHVGTLGGPTWTTEGKFGNALSFDGQGMVSIPHSSLLALSNAMTLEAWVYPTAAGDGWRDIIFKTTDIYYLMGSSSQSGLPAMGGTFTTPLFGTALLPVNEWSYLAATYDGTMLRLYVNGVPVASRAESAPLRTSTGALTIGGDTTFGQFWKGRIDEVRVYNRALSASETQDDMATPVGISLNQRPIVVATANPVIGVAPLLVAFSGSGSFDPEGALLSYNWTFGDATASSSADPSHTYHSPGVFIARLTVSDGTNSVASTNLAITVTNPPVNSLPVISPLADLSTDEDVLTGLIAFVVGDAETPAADLVVSGTSSNPVLVPDSNITFGGTGSNRTVRVMPATNQNGMATITVTVSDGALSVSQTFELTVRPVNDRPMASAIADQIGREGVEIGPVPWTVSDVETAPDLLTVSGLSSNPLLIPNENILFGGQGSNRTVRLRPAPNQHGATTITLTVSDSELDETTRFQVQVNPIEVVLAIVTKEADGSIVLRVTGVPDRGYELQASTNLTAWTSLAVLSDPSGVSQYSDSEALKQQRKFYRVVVNP